MLHTIGKLLCSTQPVSKIFLSDDSEMCSPLVWGHFGSYAHKNIARRNYRSPRHTCTPRARKRDPETSVSHNARARFYCYLRVLFTFLAKIAHVFAVKPHFMCDNPGDGRPSSVVHTPIAYTECGEVCRHIIIIIVTVHVVRVHVPQFLGDFRTRRFLVVFGMRDLGGRRIKI